MYYFGGSVVRLPNPAKRRRGALLICKRAVSVGDRLASMPDGFLFTVLVNRKRKGWLRRRDVQITKMGHLL